MGSSLTTGPVGQGVPAAPYSTCIAALSQIFALLFCSLQFTYCFWPHLNCDRTWMNCATLAKNKQEGGRCAMMVYLVCAHLSTWLRTKNGECQAGGDPSQITQKCAFLSPWVSPVVVPLRQTDAHKQAEWGNKRTKTLSQPGRVVL